MSLNKEQKQFLSAIEKHNEEGKVVDQPFIKDTLSRIKCQNFTTEDVLQKLCEEDYLLVYTYVDEVIYIRKDSLLIEVIIHLYFYKEIELIKEELSLTIGEKQKQMLKLKESITHSIIEELTQKHLHPFVLSYEQAQMFIEDYQLDAARFEDFIRESTLKFFKTFNLKDLTEFNDVKENSFKSDIIKLSFYQLNCLIKSLELFNRLVIIKVSTDNIFYFNPDSFDAEDLTKLKNKIESKKTKKAEGLFKYKESFYFEIFHKELSQYFLQKEKTKKAKIFLKENISNSDEKDLNFNNQFKESEKDENKDLLSEKYSNSVDSSNQNKITEFKEVEINFDNLSYEQLIEKLKDFVGTKEIISTITEYQNQIDSSVEGKSREVSYYTFFSTLASLVLISSVNNQKIYKIIKILQNKVKIENVKLKEMIELKIEENYDKYLSYLAKENFIKENQLLITNG